MTDEPTIFARSTGTLPSAVAIIRISGQGARAALTSLSHKPLPPPRKALMRRLFDAVTGAPLDTALVLWLPGPGTVTGEDMVELHLHGGRAVVAGVEAALARLPGFAAAEAGAFTRRAFANGRIDLTQVEGLADLLAAETERQRVAALAQAEGGLRREVDNWQAQLLQLAARAEALIDFADEDDVSAGPSDVAALQRDCLALSAALDAALDNPPAERLRDGVRVGIAGPPNAGKSTLLNALIGREAAIASPIAGTTRDLVEAPVNLGGIPLLFIDMAGLRDDTLDPVEALGIARAQAAIARCDLILWLGSPEDAPDHANLVIVAAKCDLDVPTARAAIGVSALSGENMAELTSLIARRAESLLPAIGAIALGTAQRGHLRDAAAALERSASVSDDVLRAEELRAAMRALNRITGSVDTEAMLDALFGRFCIGK